MAKAKVYATYLSDGMYVIKIGKQKAYVVSEKAMWQELTPIIVDWVEIGG